MKDKLAHTHPFLGGNQEDDSLSSILWSTDPNFPVRKLMVLESDSLKSTDTTRKLAGAITEGTGVTKHNYQLSALEPLSPFTQWLMSLKPSTLSGSNQFEHKDRSTSNHYGPQITAKSAEITPKKKKKEKKNKKARLKAEGAHNELPVLDQGIVSDTLAELIASQGHIEDAITMYRKLVTLHPEKTAFYVQRISELRQGKS